MPTRAPDERRFGPFHPVRSWRAIGLLLIAGVILAWPAICNRFPLVFFDTSSYVARSATIVRLAGGDAKLDGVRVIASQPSLEDAGHPPARKVSSNPFFLRPIFYSLWLIPFSTAATFMAAPVGQGLLAAYVLRRTLSCAGVSSDGAFVSSTLVLGLASSLPWHVSYVMPDFLTGLLVAMAFVTTSAWSRSSWPERLFDVGLTAFMIASHLSHIPITLALICAIALAGLVIRLRLGAWLGPGGGLAALTASLALAMGGLVASNVVVGKFTLSESSPLFMLARLIGDGPARAYLHRACPTHRYILCGELNRLDDGASAGSVSEHFLWSEQGVVKRRGGPALMQEAVEINRETIRAYPAEIAANALRNGIRQIGTFQLDESLNIRPPPFVKAAIANIDPDLGRRMLASRQAEGAFPLALIRRALDGALALSLIALAMAAALRRNDIPRDAWAFCAIAAVGLVANGFVTGALSEVHDRYQNRVVWLVVLMALVMGFAKRRSTSAPGVSEPMAAIPTPAAGLAARGN